MTGSRSVSAAGGAVPSDTDPSPCFEGDKGVSAVWRCGVSTGVEVADRVMAEMRKSRSKAVQRYADLLDELMQDVMDARHQHKVGSYRDAFDAHKEINVAAAVKIAANAKEATP